MRIDVSTIVSFNKSETDVLLSWYNNALEKESRHGGSAIVFPEEEYLTGKIAKSVNGEMKFNEFDIEMIFGWIEHSFFPRIGNEVVLFPNELSTYQKMQLAADIILLKKKEQLVYDRQNSAIYQKKQSVISWISGKLGKIAREREQNRQKEQIQLQALDRKIKNVAGQLAPIMEERRKKKNRTIDEKITASNQLKYDLDEIRKKLKF